MNIEKLDPERGVAIDEAGSEHEIEWIQPVRPVACMGCGRYSQKHIVSVKLKGDSRIFKESAGLCSDCLEKMKDKDYWEWFRKHGQEK